MPKRKKVKKCRNMYIIILETNINSSPMFPPSLPDISCGIYSQTHACQWPGFHIYNNINDPKIGNTIKPKNQ